MNQVAIVLVLVVSMVIVNLSAQIEKRERQLVYDSAQATFVQLALAQYRRSTEFIDPHNPVLGTKAYAITPAVLLTEGYLPVWKDDYGYWSFDTSGGLKIRFNAGTVYAARQIARRMGNIAGVVGNTVEVGFADAAELSMLNAFVKRQGDSMQGLLRFDAGIGTALQLNNNNIAGVGTLTATRISAPSVIGVSRLEAENITAVSTLDVTAGVGRIQTKAVVADTLLVDDILWVQ